MGQQMVYNGKNKNNISEDDMLLFQVVIPCEKRD